jgi:FtsZ-binding cell division protein ZapB
VSDQTIPLLLAEIESLKEKLEIEIECSRKNAERKNAEITILRKELDSLRRGK